MISRKPVVGAVVGASSWFLGYWATRLAGEGMSAVSAYALLSGWWLTAYVSSRLGLSLAAAALLSSGYWALFIVAALAGQTWLYAEVAALAFAEAVWIGFLQAAVIGSPIVFDRLVDRVGNACRGAWNSRL